LQYNKLNKPKLIDYHIYPFNILLATKEAIAKRVVPNNIPNALPGTRLE